MLHWGRIVGVALALAAAARGEPTGGFNREVRPILANFCFKCHGPDDKTREAGLRLDQRDAALAKTESGAFPIVPGDANASELVRRVLSHDPDAQMPPPSSKKQLSAEQKKVLSDWVNAGATFEPHWAFEKPKQAPPPIVARAQWARHPIDLFILQRLEAAGLPPSPEAERHTLARRVYLDLLGLPPTPEESRAFAEDPSPLAYERLVDRLLASPRYGERWARRWLDLARYADTNGYEKDRARSIWPYRDWVINAINADMPFDQFSIEQLAGDLLPGAGESERIATGLHRNTMLNEEGGIDPLEFRFHAVVDRVNTTGVIWLGMTVGCAQCHTHKYDPFTQRDYYQMMAFLNNADEPEMDVARPEIARERADREAEIKRLEDGLADRFPPAESTRWMDATTIAAKANKATLRLSADGSILASGPAAATDVYTVELETDAPRVTSLRIEALADSVLPAKGPGRTAHGNFVLTELSASVAAPDGQAAPRTVPFASASTDFAQDGFSAAATFDGNPKTGWAIHGPDPWNVDRTLTLRLADPVVRSGKTRWTIRLNQDYGGGHTLGKFRIRLGESLADDRPESVRREENLKKRFRAWTNAESGKAVRWRLLDPAAAKSEIPTLTILPDKSILVSGDQSKRDVYQVRLTSDLPRIRGLRLEIIPDESLPKNGPGRVSYEGPFGDFFLSEFVVTTRGQRAKIKEASHSFANGKNGASAAIDGDPATGWSIDGGQGRTHAAVFTLASPIEAGSLDLELLFERYYAAGLGRFRIWATDDDRPLVAKAMPTDVEEILLVDATKRSDSQLSRLRSYFLSVAPELAGERAKIAAMRAKLPSLPTTLVMRERPAHHPRRTYRHHRGEFLQPKEAVEASLPSLFASAGAASDRLSFARWLVSDANPLAARVAVNRYWAVLFGKGIVPTTEDFGYQGVAPSHPELLDWLAVEFQRRGWSVKRLHRLIVTSSVYRQSSRITPASLDKDPTNRLLGRFPRSRLDAEVVRDLVLRASGLLSDKMLGPSVFPPQPTSVATEGAYGPLAWKLSAGEDRYRRGLYTFAKRTAPYAMSATFDAPSGEACLARREPSNTPLQALTLLNDTVVMEAAQSLGKLLAHRESPDASRIDELFLRCLGRPADEREREAFSSFLDHQRRRLAQGSLDPRKIAGVSDGDVASIAAWTLAARAALNLDETIMKE